MDEDKIQDKSDSTPPPYMVPGAIIVAGVLIAGAVMYSNLPRLQGPAAVAPGKGSSNAGANKPVVIDSKSLVDDDPSLGNPEASVTMVEFGDFQCPFCQRLFKETLPQIKEKYVKTGKVRFVYRDFPLTSIHGQAQKSAEAAECANEQGKFWQYHDLLYERQSALGLENYKKWAMELGLDVEQFNKCLDSGKYSDEVGKDLGDGQAAGVTGTPGTFVNGRLVQGALPYAQFEAIIEEELKKAK